MKFIAHLSLALTFSFILFIPSLLKPPNNVYATVPLTVFDDGTAITISWEEIPELSIGDTYYLGVWPIVASGCPSAIAQISPFPITFNYISSASHHYSWVNAPAGTYYAGLYTYGGALSDCPSFSVTRAGGGGAGGAACQGFIDCLSDIAVLGLKPEFTEQGLVGKIISAFLPALLGIAGFVTVIIIIISGIQFVTSGGNPEAAAAARGRLTFAIIGFVIIVLAFAILQIVDKLFLGNSGIV